MSDPKIAQQSRSVSQNQLRAMVERQVTPVIQMKRGPETRVEEAFVRAIYAPDRRLG